jgi:hypothetical protein
VWNSSNETWDSAYAPRAATIPISSPNYIINSAFDIWQRGTSTTTTTAGYRTADRWATWIDSGSGTIQQDTTNVPAFIQFGIRYTSSGANGSCVFYHTIETLNAELLAGKTVNLSAYLSGTTGKSVQVSLWSSTTTDTAFSGTWDLVGATAYSLTTAVTRVSASYVIPANAKTVQVRVYNLDKLANTEFVSFTGMQLEEGVAATDFRRNANSIAGELVACQRYYEAGEHIFQMQSWTNNPFVPYTARATFYKVTKRISPTISFTITNGDNAGTTTIPYINQHQLISQTLVNNSSFPYNAIAYAWTASAEL